MALPEQRIKLGHGLNGNFPEVFLFAELAEDVATDFCQRDGLLLFEADVPCELKSVHGLVFVIVITSFDQYLISCKDFFILPILLIRK
jgi:hypothetical protein